MAGGPRRGGRRRKKFVTSQQTVLHISTTKIQIYLKSLSQKEVKSYHVV